MKTMPSSRLVSVDPSLTCSGWALFRLPVGELLAVGKMRSKPPPLPLPLRLKDLQEQVRFLFEQLNLGASDYLICEAPTTMRDPRAALKVEQVRGIFESLARERLMQVPGRINPRTVQYEVMGLRGRQLTRGIVKETAVQIAHRTFSRQLSNIGFDPSLINLRRHQDIVDALLIGSLGVTRVLGSHHAKLPVEEAFAERPHRVGRRLQR